MVYQEKKTFIVTYVIIISGSITLLFNYLLIPLFFSYGAAWANVFGSVTNFMLLAIIVRKYYYVEYDFIKIFTLLFILAIVVFCDIKYNNFPEMYSLIVKIGIGLSSLLYIAIFKKEQFKVYLKQY